MNTHLKVTVAGNVINTLMVEIPIAFGYKDKTKKKKIKQTDPEKIKETRIKTLRSIRSYCKQLINTNNWYWARILKESYNPAFITVTFKENTQELDFANREHSKFMQNLKYFVKENFGVDLIYIGVPEFQKRGAIHYHILIFNLPYIPKVYDHFRSLWPHGSLNFKSVKNIKHIANYVCKYMLKDADDQRLTGRKCYFRSRKLFEPNIIRNQSEALQLIEQLPPEFKVFEKDYEDEYHKTIRFSSFELPYEHTLLPQINRG